MKRRNFINNIGGSIAATSLLAGQAVASQGTPADSNTEGQPSFSSVNGKTDLSNIRSAFPRLEKETYLDAAGTMPLSSFSESGLQKYHNFNRLGYKHGGGEYISQMQKEIRGLFASLIKAKENEIGFVQNTKSGEQIALNAVDGIKPNGNIVANDLNFPRSLHNLIGLKKAGRDVRIVRAKNWRTSLEKMKVAIDDKTAVVAITLVSNINGHIEEVAELAKHAHKHGAILYADIIQAAGIVPIDIHKMGIDIAACSCYKWLYGVHGTGFLFVNEKHQGTTIEDELYPGFFRHNYLPWVDQPDPNKEDIPFREPKDATRYQAGHISYLGYCAAYEGLKFIHQVGTDALLAHSVKLNQLLLSKLDGDRYQCISTHIDKSPIITFKTRPEDDIRAILSIANIKGSFGQNRLRISPAIYNNENDIELLVKALSA